MKLKKESNTNTVIRKKRIYVIQNLNSSYKVRVLGDENACILVCVYVCVCMCACVQACTRCVVCVAGMWACV